MSETFNSGDQVPQYEKNRIGILAKEFEPKRPWDHGWYKTQTGADDVRYWRKADNDATMPEPRTLSEIIEARKVYESRLKQLNQGISDYRAGNKNPTTSDGRVIVSGTTEDGHGLLDPAFMRSVREAANAFNPGIYGGDDEVPLPGGGMGPGLHPLSLGPNHLPALGEGGEIGNHFGLRPYTFSVRGDEIPWDERMDPNSPEWNRLYTYPDDPNKHRRWESDEAPPDWYTENVDRFGNNMLSEQEDYHDFRDSLLRANWVPGKNTDPRDPRGRGGHHAPATPEQVQKILFGRALPPLQGGIQGMPVPIPDYMDGAQAAQWMDMIGQNWFGPTWGPEGSGNLILNMLDRKDWRGNRID